MHSRVSNYVHLYSIAFFFSVLDPLSFVNLWSLFIPQTRKTTENDNMEDNGK